MHDDFIIPLPMQIVLDDVGWFCGDDDRRQGGPSRTGSGRFHRPEDYRAIEALGEKLGMRINCAFVLGEWDLENELKDLPHFSPYGDGWDNARFRDRAEMAEMVGIVNESPHIDMAIHGLYHGYYMDGTDNKDVSDFYYRVGGALHMIPETEVRQRLDAFRKLTEVHGFRKDINSFVPPSFAYREGELSRILAEYGILYMSTIFETMLSDRKEEYAVVENGIINCDRFNNAVPWEALAYDFSTLPTASGVYGIHWPNICGSRPEEYPAVVDRAADFFRRCGAQYGTVLSKDMAFCAAQEIYRRYTKVTCGENAVTLDFSDVPAAAGLADAFCVSTKRPVRGFAGCEVAAYETQEGHRTYRVTRRGASAKLMF